jgi:hypothetical protein
MSATNLNRASQEWVSRPEDQRFLSLEELKASVLQRKRESWTATPRCRDLRVLPTETNDRVDLEIQAGKLMEAVAI